MAKAVGKGKEKKLQRKAEQEKAQQLKIFIDELNKAPDLLQDYPAFSRYDRNGLLAMLTCFSGSEWPANLLEWALRLTKLHMQGLYEDCPSWGWCDASKKAELAHPNARIICVFENARKPAAAESSIVGPAAQVAPVNKAAEASTILSRPAPGKGNGHEQLLSSDVSSREADSNPLAFMHFRFEEESGEPVLYLYEIQIAQQAQGRGLGKFLMQLLELMARRSGVARLMLTVFHGNTAARALYRKLGYTLDEGSPAAVDPTTADTYDILTKRLAPRNTLC